MTRPAEEPRAALLALYEQALPRVFGYLAQRTGSVAVAEDLTAETFLAAVTALRDGTVQELTPAWLMSVARNKLVDHWRRAERERRSLRVVAAEPGPVVEDTWDQRLDALRARDVLGGLGAHHRAALTLRYLDGLGVPEVARALNRTVHATEALLVRARTAFRRAYQDGEER